MDQFIWARLKEAMERYGLDGLVASSRENITYIARYIVPSQLLNMRARQFAVALNRDGKAAMLLTSNELPEAQERSAVKDLRPYDQFADDPMATLASILRDLGVAEGRIGLEMDAFPAERWEALKVLLKKAQWENGTKPFQHARMIKTPAELEILRKSARIADIAQAETHPYIKPGITEHQIYRHLADQAIAHGADRLLMIQVAAGERSTFSNPVPSERRLKRGEIVKIDIFVDVGGYLSDTGRAFVVGEASDAQKEIWARMQETQAAILATIKPGVSTLDLWRVFTDTFGRYQMEPCMRFLGHGLGLSLHEEPFVASHLDTELKEGMVFAIEPVFMTEDRKMGFHLEDNLVVTSEGVENMTSRFGPELLVLG